ncbi:glycosyltransferase-like domain-containing protein 1 [Lingula anatina]|uniref:Glycosyltransferase-like domain-containing protein 1 n=1 Tax=Lingula anatina TaxID=7574 RepID=A0A2R2MKX9_LINAN|nr:glycosyltransferase-like domain-containing protein 1 [Lingula anatina]|eukprot:XP_023930864.1 glycosyltransferase-like domain-containing protein 1 [Lingula anatina]
MDFFVSEIFTTAKGKLKEEIVNWGYQPCKEDYYKVLCSADVAVSTAIHEFFGVAMLEAVHCGCYPLVPSRLVYPEIFPKTYLYNTPAQLAKKLRNFCKFPHLVRLHTLEVNPVDYSWDRLKGGYRELLHAE